MVEVVVVMSKADQYRMTARQCFDRARTAKISEEAEALRDRGREYIEMAIWLEERKKAPDEAQ